MTAWLVFAALVAWAILMIGLVVVGESVIPAMICGGIAAVGWGVVGDLRGHRLRLPRCGRHRRDRGGPR